MQWEFEVKLFLEVFLGHVLGTSENCFSEFEFSHEGLYKSGGSTCTQDEQSLSQRGMLEFGFAREVSVREAEPA